MREFAVVALQCGADDLEGVQRIAVVGRVHARIQDGEARAVKVAANACEQIALVGCVHQHLQAFASQRLARPHHRLLRAHVA